MSRSPIRRSSVALVALLAACGHAPPPEPAPAPPPPPPPPAPRPPAGEGSIPVCVVSDSILVSVVIWQRGDTTYSSGNSFPHPARVASEADWYRTNKPIRVLGRLRVKYGLPRVLGPGDVVRVGEYDGVPVFAESAAATEVVYLPASQSCEFQTYVNVAVK